MDFLVVGPAAANATGLEDSLRSLGATAVVRSLGAARRMWEERGPALGVLFVGGEVGSNVRWVDGLREQGALTRWRGAALAMVNEAGMALCGEAQEAGVLLTQEVRAARALRVWASQALDWDSVVFREAARFAREHGLSQRERDLLYLTAQGVLRSELAATMGLGDSTVKTLVRRLLAKAAMEALPLQSVLARFHGEARKKQRVRAALPPWGGITGSAACRGAA